MSDLVGNPEDRFSQNEAQIRVVIDSDCIVKFVQLAGNKYLRYASSSYFISNICKNVTISPQSNNSRSQNIYNEYGKYGKVRVVKA